MSCLTPARRSRAVSWKPWAELPRRPHIELVFDRLPPSTGGAMFVRDGGRAWIVLDPRLGRAERLCFITHELIHDELGSSCRADGMPETWNDVVSRSEVAIDREVAARLVPGHRLAAFLRGSGCEFEVVCVHQVAEHFDVTEHIAEIALSRYAATHDWTQVVA